MQWLTIFMCFCAAAAIDLRCVHPQCDDTKISYTPGVREYTVEGHNIKFQYTDINDGICEEFSIECGGWQALDSPATPRFADELRVSSVDLSNCPLPANNASLAAALAALNVTLQPVDDQLSLSLVQFPADYLTRHHFVGFERLTNLEINNKFGFDPHRRPTPEPGFLAGLQKLRWLYLISVRLPAGEIYHFPRSLRRLWLNGESLNSLPSALPDIISETVRALPDLQHLRLDQWEFTAPEFTDSVENGVKLQLNETYSLESISLSSWKHRELEPFENCNALLSLELQNPEVEKLPDRWVAACPRLEDLTLEFAKELYELPAKLLDGATALERLTIRCTEIRSLPAGFLRGAPNLLILNLSDNKIRGTLPSDVFLGPALQSLSIPDNRLRTQSLTPLATLTSLTELNLGGNQYIYDLCEENGYSLLRNLTNLKKLSLTGTHVTRICRDWRESFTLLKTLDLEGTDITGLKSTDFFYTRDKTVSHAKIKLSPSLYSVNFTKSDYDTIFTSSGPGATIKFEYNWRYPQRDILCDCSTYWLRRAVDIGRVKINGLPCKNGWEFKKKTAEEMCPEEQRYPN